MKFKVTRIEIWDVQTEDNAGDPIIDDVQESINDDINNSQGNMMEIGEYAVPFNVIPMETVEVKVEVIKE